MKFKRLLLAVLIVSAPLVASAQEEVMSVNDVSEANLPKQPLTPKVLYEFLLAEIALGRGQTAVAAAAYADLAKQTRDPRIAQRAAEVAFYAHQPTMSLDAAKLWTQTDPASITARQAYWTLLATAGKNDELAEDMKAVLASDSVLNRGALLVQLGRFVARFEDKKGANQVAQKFTAPYLDLPEAHFVRAQSVFSVGDSAGAMQELDAALKLKPDWEAAAILKAQLLIANPNAVIDWLASFLKQYPDARDARLAYARALIEGKRYDDARNEFATLLKAEPNRPDLLYSLGLLSLQLGDTKKAESYLKSLLDKDFAESDSVHFYLGQIAENAKRVPEAIAQYDAVMPGTAHYLQAQGRAATLLASTGQLQQARDRLHVAQQANPKYRSDLLVLEAQMLGDNGRNADAYQLLADAVAASPNDTTLLYESALYAERLGKTDVLERNLRKVIALKPDYAHAYNALGYSLADRNQRLEEANALIDKALAMAPQDAAILDSKGWVNYRRGDLPGALAMLQKALAQRPDPEIAAHLGEVLWKMGRRDEATKTWDEALKIAPDNEVLNGTIKRLRQ